MDDARYKKSCSNMGSKIFLSLAIMASTIIIGIYYYYPNYRFEIRANWISTKSNNHVVDEDATCGSLFRRTWIGRLGNQMFQYASFYGMVHDYRRNRSMDDDRRIKIIFASSKPNELRGAFENLSLFRYNDVENRLLPQTLRMDHLDQDACCRFEPVDWSKLKCDNVSFEVGGYRQSFKYFENARDEIRREYLLNFRKSVRDECDQRFKNISIDRPACMIVGVHLRRGDMTLPGHSPATESYFQRAVQFFEETYYSNLRRFSPKYKCLLFILFGDDYGWNLQTSKKTSLLYPNSTRIELIDSSKSSPAVDLCLLSKCNHVAMSVGTFGWWGGYLSRGIVTYQKAYASNDDYVLSDWIPL